MPTPLPWGDEFLVNSMTLNNQYDPTITVLADGRFVVAWETAARLVATPRLVP